MDTIDMLLQVKLTQLEVGWIKNSTNRLCKKSIDEEEDLVYKISCCYFIFSQAASNYKDVPDALSIAAFYCHSIIQIIEKNTGENIQELADRINRKEKSIPSNLLFWCDIIEKEKEKIYREVCEFIQMRTNNILSCFDV